MTGPRTQAINDITKLIRDQASKYYDETGQLVDPTGTILDDLADQIEILAVDEPKPTPVGRFWRKALFILISWPVMIALAYGAVHGLFFGSIIITAIFHRTAEFEAVLFTAAFTGIAFGLILGNPFIRFATWIDGLIYRFIVGVPRPIN